MANFKEVLAYVQEWAQRTDRILIDGLNQYGIGITAELFDSLRSRVYELASDQIGYDLSFLTYGRFRDMGAGRPAKIETREMTRAELKKHNLKGRKPAKWYSKRFYGRLNALSGVVSASMVEQAIEAVRAVARDKSAFH